MPAGGHGLGVMPSCGMLHAVHHAQNERWLQQGDTLAKCTCSSEQDLDWQYLGCHACCRQACAAQSSHSLVVSAKGRHT